MKFYGCKGEGEGRQGGFPEEVAFGLPAAGEVGVSQVSGGSRAVFWPIRRPGDERDRSDPGLADFEAVVTPLRHYDKNPTHVSRVWTEMDFTGYLCTRGPRQHLSH